MLETYKDSRCPTLSLNRKLQTAPLQLPGKASERETMVVAAVALP